MTRLPSRPLTQAVADGSRLVLVGDVDQLPSVGPGSFLRDAIDSGVVPCVRLVKIFRQAEQSLIVQNAHRINAGQSPIVPEPGNTNADFFMIDKRDPDEARKVLGLPADVEPIAFTPLGYAADQGPTKKQRKPLSELVRYEHW